MRSLLIIILFFSSIEVGAQSLDIGFSIGTNAYQRSLYTAASYAPSNGYFNYYEKNTGSGVINKHNSFNAFYTGGVFSFSYKRFTINLELQYGIQRSVYRFQKEYPIDRVVGRKSFRMPFYLTYKFFKKKNSLYLLMGATLNADKNFDIQSPGGFEAYIGGGKSYKDVPDLGDNHMYGVLYDEFPYWTTSFGLGRRFNKWNLSLRYSRSINITKHNILATIWQMEMHLGFSIVSTRDFTKKHFLYVE